MHINTLARSHAHTRHNIRAQHTQRNRIAFTYTYTHSEIFSSYRIHKLVYSHNQHLPTICKPDASRAISS